MLVNTLLFVVVTATQDSPQKEGEIVREREAVNSVKTEELRTT